LAVQVRNFCAAKTTNERYSRRKPVTEKANNMVDSTSSDSLNGNLLNADDDNEAQKPQPQYYHESNGNCITNCWTM